MYVTIANILEKSIDMPQTIMAQLEWSLLDDYWP
jgi:hypothetical protein